MKLRFGRNAVIFLSALVVATLAAWAMHHYLRARMADIEAQANGVHWEKVLVAKRALPSGTVLSADTVAQRDVPAEWVHSNAIRPQDFERAENQTLAIEARAGEMLLWAQLVPAAPTSFAARLGVGQRAVTVPVDEVNSVSGMIEPGDRIDLVAVFKNDGQTLMLTLLQNAAVLATGNKATPDEGGGDSKAGYTTITLETSAQQARQVLAAREVGKLAALLRSPGDAQRGPVGPDAAAQLLGLPAVAAAASVAAVPVIYGNDPSLRETRRAQAVGGRP